MNYPNMCGSCKHFSFFVINGVLKYRGHCDCANTGYFMNNSRHSGRYKARNSAYRQASQRACKKYESEVG